MNRFQQLRGTRFDLIIIGGGIVGAGIARDASLRGLKVALFDRHDFGSGTTAGSTRLIHGGLRYLETLDFKLVRLDLRERETLLRIAPHLVKPLEFMIPFYRLNLMRRIEMRLGMLLYDILSYDKSLPNHSVLSAAEAKYAEPSLRASGLQGAATYFDAQVNSPERLCLENIIDAGEHGACAMNYAEVIGMLGSNRVIQGVSVRDLLSGDELDVEAEIVINAAGPWLDEVNKALVGEYEPSLRTTKGIHIACPRQHKRALVLSSGVDGRLFFAIPWLRYSWIGTTETDFSDDPSHATASRADVHYLLQSVREFLPPFEPGQIYFTNAGVRALIRQAGRATSITRMHRIVDGERKKMQGLVSVHGGKLTGYRHIAEEVTDLVCKKMKRDRPCRTATIPLPGARGSTEPLARAGVLSRQVVEHLSSLYGSRAAAVIELAESNPEMRVSLDPAYPDIVAQVAYAIRSEQCQRLCDFFQRRTLLAFAPDQGVQAIRTVAELMATELGWSTEEQSSQVRSYEEQIDRSQTFRQECNL